MNDEKEKKYVNSSGGGLTLPSSGALMIYLQLITIIEEWL